MIQAFIECIACIVFLTVDFKAQHRKSCTCSWSGVSVPCSLGILVQLCSYLDLDPCYAAAFTVIYIYKVNVHHIGHGSQRKDWLEKLLILLSEMATVQSIVPGFILTKTR